MKAVRLLSVSMLICLAATSASMAADTYVGLYLNDTHDSWCASGGPMYTVELWVWAYSPDSGFTAISFFTTEDVNIDYGEIVHSPDLDPRPIVCKKPCPWFFIFMECQTGWVWLMHAPLYVSTADPIELELLPVDPENGDVVNVTNCNNDFVFGKKLSSVFLNYDPGSSECMGLSVETVTWGAIKSMFGN